MKICHVAGALHGGPLASVTQLAKYQVLAGHDVEVVYSSLRDRVEDLRAAFAPGVALWPWRVGREISAGDLHSFCELLRIVRHIKPDVLHLHSSKAGVHGRVAAKILGIPNVYSPRGLSFLRDDISPVVRNFYYFLEQIASRFGNLTVACSTEELEALGGLQGDRRLIPNGIDLADPILARVRQMRNHNSHPFRIIVSGRITAARGPERVAAIVAAAPSDWQFLWVGDGELRHLLAGTRIQITGWLDRAKVLELVSEADVLLHPSRWEGMPNAVIEAMALAVPVVASDIVGNRSLVVEGQTGFLVNNENGYVPAIAKLAESTELRKHMGAEGRRRIESLFDAEQLAKEWSDIYKALVSRRRPFFDRSTSNLSDLAS